MKWRKSVRVALAIVAMSVIPLFAQNRAQNTDDEIKALEKELRLLELQKQIEQAKRGKSAQESQSESQEKAEQMQDSTKSTCGNEYALTSCYFGFEFGAIFGSSVKYSYIDKYSGMIKSTDKYSGIIESKVLGSYVALPFRLIGGYQWYFHDKMGVGVNALLGYSSVSSWRTFSYVAITWGADVQYLVDFTRIVGMSLGLGFEMSHFIYADTLISSSEYTPAFVASVGIHFNTTNFRHRFGLNYKYRLYKNATITTNKIEAHIKPSGAGMFTFSYMYRF